VKNGFENIDSEPIIAEKKYLTTEVSRYTIENKNGTRLIVSNYGAAVVSLFVKDKHGRLADVVLGYDTHAEYQDDEVYLGTVVGRYANRIASGTVVIDKATYKLYERKGGYHLHGGLEGFNKKIFTAHPFANASGSGIIFTYTSPHLEEGFPGELHLEVTYSLSEDDCWTVEYRAKSTATTLINLTQHSYFNLSGNLSNSIDGHELKIPTRFYLPVNNMQVPTGEIAEVINTPFDFTEFKKIGKDINRENTQLELSNGFDHSFVLEKQHSPVLKHAAIVVEPVTGRKLDVYTTEPAVHFYSGNFLDNIKGKNGEIYHQRSGFCLETQHFPDAPNHKDFPTTVLNAGEQFYSKTMFTFSVDQ
jgi:aldose 1-epimerase